MSPRQLPPPTQQQVAVALTAAGAGYGSNGVSVSPTPPSGAKEAGDDQQEEGSPPPPPPPVWQTRRPAEKAVVTEADRKGFAHFWLANVEKRLLVVAIPKVRFLVLSLLLSWFSLVLVVGAAVVAAVADDATAAGLVARLVARYPRLTRRQLIYLVIYIAGMPAEVRSAYATDTHPF